MSTPNGRQRAHDTRHGSESSASSWRSQDTIKQPSQRKRGIQDTFESGSLPSSAHRSGSPNISPTDRRQSYGFSNHRRALAKLGNDNRSTSATPPPLPSISKQSASASSPTLPSNSEYGTTFFRDSSEYEFSPSLRPDTAQTGDSNSPDPEDADEDEETFRRPSVASGMTVSSQGSRSSGGRFHKRLQGFFGDEYQGKDSAVPPQGSLTSRVPSASSRGGSSGRGRKGSTHSTNPERAPSPNGSRPLTPLPSSDIAPWEYQNFTDIPNLGEAPIRSVPTDPNSQRHQQSKEKQKTRPPNRLLAGHRHSSSKEDNPPTVSLPTYSPFPSRSTSHRDDGGIANRSLRENLLVSTPMSMNSSSTLGTRSDSPTGSADSGKDPLRPPHSPGAMPPKWWYFGRKLRPKAPHSSHSAKNLPTASRTSQDSAEGQKFLLSEQSPSGRLRNRSFEGPSREWDPPDSGRKKEPSKLRRPFVQGKDGKQRRGPPTHEHDKDYHNVLLDLNLRDMSGIVTDPRPVSPTDSGGIFTGTEPIPPENNPFQNVLEAPGTDDWQAPDSWQVKKPNDDIVGRLAEISNEEEGGEEVDQDGLPFCIRVFRVDSTFATLSAGLNTTVTQLLEMLGRKSFLQDDLNHYDIVMRKNDLSRTLNHGERPIMIQKRLLTQAGYHQSDRIAEVGREDNSYLCRFTFLPTKLGVYSNLDPDLGFSDNQKYVNVDLTSKRLATIPLKLYSRAPEIKVLKLSRNLGLDVPKDFIQSCINLREIRFLGNEAWHLPASLSLATTLTYLDISNNRLEQLEHAELHKLKGLVTLKMANNKLSYLPSNFGDFPVLRSIDISSNYFRAFPKFLEQLPCLVELKISFNQLDNLSDIGKFKALEHLSVTNNHLTGILDHSIDGLNNLREIDARYNNIRTVNHLTALPRLEELHMSHNSVSTFSGTFNRLSVFALDHCPVTQFDITSPLPTLRSLNIASAKLVEFKDSLFTNIQNVTKLNLSRNFFVTLSPNIGSLRRLEYLDLSQNRLSLLPPSIGCLTELKTLNLRECNLSKLPPEIWYCLKLENLNVASNVLVSFPKLGSSSPPPLPSPVLINGSPAMSGGSAQSYEELGRLEDFELRRPSQASSNYLNVGTPPSDSMRKGSMSSIQSPGGSSGRKASLPSRSTDTGGRKDSTLSQRVANTFALSLRQLSLGDNRLEDDIFNEIIYMTELRVLNLSFNLLTELPLKFMQRLPNVNELYLSGNQLSILHGENLGESNNLKVLHLNANKFQVLPAELRNLNNLSVLDVGSNSLKYNVTNWQFDWNWKWNHNLRYLNFSGNKRFEIKQIDPAVDATGAESTDFSSLNYIRVLGLMDVTLINPNIPDQTEDRRVRTSASLSGYIAYGLADSLGKNEHMSMIDMVIPRFRGNDMETILGLFDGQAATDGGSKIAKFLHENFTATFTDELNRLRKQNEETPEDALRRTFLALNKDMATAAYKPVDDKESRHWDRSPTAGRLLNRDDAQTGGVATVLYLDNMELYVANVGDVQGYLIQTSGQFVPLTRNHDPTDDAERERIREAGGYVSRGKLNGQLSVSRAFGYYHLLPAVMAEPNTCRITLTAQDEMIILASGHLWQYISPNVAVDVARDERADLMIASQKIRDMAIAYGASDKLMVMIAGVSDLKKRERNKFRGPSLSMGPSSFADEHIFPVKKRPGKLMRDPTADSMLARLGHVEAPTGELAIIFTDIKKSTSLWETYPLAMRSAIQIHNDLFRRQLRIIGGFEVKTEGDAFMVSFSTVTAALLWCFTCQTKLLEAQWPNEILQTPICRERYDPEGNMIYRGLSVRMGMHWGRPVCEKDPVTGRMDYFGPMVNRASRISAVADGGQIFVSSDFVTEVQRTYEANADDEQSSTGSEDAFSDDYSNQNVRRELYQLTNLGFEAKDLGERKLKGLENPESVYLMYPHSLSGRLIVGSDVAEEEDNQGPGILGRDTEMSMDADMFWRMMKTSLRLESLCGALEDPNSTALSEPDTHLINALKARGEELSDSTLMNILEHQVARIETCTNTLAVRHMLRPFKPGARLQDHAVPMSDILQELHHRLAELNELKNSWNPSMLGACP
ncbi:cysteinyl-tRNA synthetase [Myotisia sp. PD_48]|nr:cysteinyl-tRNA synthetase [Myotisia sp. PD_48]